MGVAKPAKAVPYVAVLMRATVCRCEAVGSEKLRLDPRLAGGREQALVGGDEPGAFAFGERKVGAIVDRMGEAPGEARGRHEEFLDRNQGGEWSDDEPFDIIEEAAGNTADPGGHPKDMEDFEDRARGRDHVVAILAQPAGRVGAILFEKPFHGDGGVNHECDHLAPGE